MCVVFFRRISVALLPFEILGILSSVEFLLRTSDSFFLPLVIIILFIVVAGSAFLYCEELITCFIDCFSGKTVLLQKTTDSCLKKKDKTRERKKRHDQQQHHVTKVQVANGSHTKQTHETICSNFFFARCSLFDLCFFFCEIEILLAKELALF